MLIDRIRTKVIAFLNTDTWGNFKNADLNSFLHHAIQDRYEELFRDLAYFENMESAGRIRQFIQSQADKTRAKLQHYYASAALADIDGLTKTKPADLNYIDEIEEDTNGYTYEQQDNAREYNINKTAATAQYPIWMDGGSVIRIYPSNATGHTIHYLRTPAIPNWTYDSVTGLFNPSSGSFVDADVHPSEETEMVRKVLMSFGINLKEQDIVQMALAEDQQEFNQENSL